MNNRLGMANPRPLTAKQEAFAQAVARGRNQSAAYRFAYEAGDMAPATIWNNAHVLAKHNEVATRIHEIREAVAACTVWNRGQLLAELWKNLERAQQHNKLSAANQALRQIAKLSGLL